MGLHFNQSVNRFRTRRGEILQAQILDTARSLGRDIVVLDIGGRADYWLNVGLKGVARVILLNTSAEEFQGTGNASDLPDHLFEMRIGNGCDLKEYPDGSFDLVHSNSVIEHVGGWENMAAMARESRRVGRTGWMQTPAAEFPIEPHFHLPFVHWLGKGAQAEALKLSPIAAYRQCSNEARRNVVDSIRLLTGREIGVLFPGAEVYTETLVVPKSYVARWHLPAH